MAMFGKALARIYEFFRTNPSFRPERPEPPKPPPTSVSAERDPDVVFSELYGGKSFGSHPMGLNVDLPLLSPDGPWVVKVFQGGHLVTRKVWDRGEVEVELAARKHGRLEITDVFGTRVKIHFFSRKRYAAEFRFVGAGTRRLFGCALREL